MIQMPRDMDDLSISEVVMNEARRDSTVYQGAVFDAQAFYKTPKDPPPDQAGGFHKVITLKIIAWLRKMSYALRRILHVPCCWVRYQPCVVLPSACTWQRNVPAKHLRM